MKKWRALISGLLSLYFILTISHNVLANEDFPFISFTTINRYAESAADFDEVDDARNFTSEALFSQSQARLNRSLTNEELTGIIRTKEQFETFNNLRFRLTNSFAIDLSYKYREIDDAQITNFFVPNQFNDVNLNEYGVSIQSSFNAKSYSFLIRGTYKQADREGVIEFFPNRNEDIDHYEVNAAISRAFGDNMMTLYPTYVFQDINLDIPNPYNKEREILALTLTYGKQTVIRRLEEAVRPISAIENIFERRFDMRGMKFFGGIVHNKETFDDVDVKQNDYFVGTSFVLKPIDITIEPDIFTYEVQGDDSRDNAQYRTNVIIYYQISEAVLLSVPFRHDVAIDGPDDFENWKLGIELSSSLASKKRPNTRFFTSLRYDHQRFFNVGKDLDLFSFNINIGF